MPLRFRRGTNAERLTITPAEGEPIYVTDTKALYIGDGTTQGGTLITSSGSATTLNDLIDVDLTTTPPTNGQVLKWNGTAFVPANDTDTTLTISGISVGALADVDLTTTPPTNGQVLKWNGTAFVPANDIDTTLTISGISVGALADVDLSTPPTTGQVLKWNGAAFVPSPDLIGSVTSPLIVDIQGSVFDTNGNLIIDNALNEITTDKIFAFRISSSEILGTFEGNVRGFDQSTLLDAATRTLIGNVQGSVLGSDSVVLLNHETRTLTGNVNGDLYGNIKNDTQEFIYSSSTNTFNADTFRGNNFESKTGVDITLSTSNTALVINQLGTITAVNGLFEGDIIGDVTGDLTGNVLSSDGNTTLVNAISNTHYGKFAGNLIGDVVGSIFGDDSTVLVDGINNEFFGDITGSVISSNADVIIDHITKVGNFSSVNSQQLNLNNKLIIDPIDASFKVDNTFNFSSLNGRTPISVKMASSSTSGSVLLGSPNVIEIAIVGSDINNPTDIASGDLIGGIGVAARQTSLSESYNFFGFQADPQATVTPTYVPGKAFIVVAADQEVNGFRIISFTSAGKFGINIENPQAELDVKGLMKLEIKTSAPNSPIEGMIAIADGNVAGWDPKGTNGGTSYPVYYNGTSWIPMA